MRILALVLALTVLCGGLAAVAKTVTCPVCGGTGRFMCTSCSGSGRSTCFSCGGLGMRTTTLYRQDPFTGAMIPYTQMVPCTSCGGSGRTICINCSGLGYKNCSRCGGTGHIEDGQGEEPEEPETPHVEGVDDPDVPYKVAYGTVLAGTRSNRTNENIGCMLDGDVQTKYCTATTSLYVIWKAPDPIAVTGYTITTGNDTSYYTGRNPKSWTLYGSEKKLARNSGQWQKLHEVKNDKVLKPVDFTAFSFSIGSAAPACQYFKLEVTENGGDGCIQLSEFRLKGNKGTGEAGPTEATVGALKYALDGKQKTAAVVGPAKSGATSASVPATVKVEGTTYKVTEVRAGAFRGMAKLAKVTLGKNVAAIGRKAFFGCKALRKLAIKTRLLTAKTVGAAAFKGIHASAVVTCPKGMAGDYGKLLRSRGAGSGVEFR